MTDNDAGAAAYRNGDEAFREWLMGERVKAFQAGWYSVPEGAPGDRTRAGIEALDDYDTWDRRGEPPQWPPAGSAPAGPGPAPNKL